MNSKNVGKLIRGVIYDDIDLADMCDNIMCGINTAAANIKHGDPETTRMIKDLETDYETLRDYVTGMGAIASMTRYNFETGVHHNLIIPKESLSANLVNELEKIDLGKTIYNDYTHHFLTERGILENEVVPEDFCNEEEEILKAIDNAKFYHNGKFVSKEEFFRDHPEHYDELRNVIRNTIFGMVG